MSRPATLACTCSGTEEEATLTIGLRNTPKTSVTAFPSGYFAAAKARFYSARLTRLATQARVLAWICALRLVAGIGLMVATRGASGAKDEIPQLTSMTLVVLAFFDGVIVLAIAGWTATGLKRAAQLARPDAPDPPAWH